MPPAIMAVRSAAVFKTRRPITENSASGLAFLISSNETKKTLAVLGFMFVVALALWLLLSRSQAERATTPQTKKEPTPEASPTYITTKAPLQEPGGPYAPADPRWPERTRRLKADPQYEWKTPIEFYGKVVDQDGMPVAGATADVIWTDMSANGSSQMEATSGTAGLFSITGIHGKHMTVQVNKEGYYRQLTDAKSAFEYAGFWEPSYHIPDKEKPVIFRLRKKGEAAALVRYGPTLFGVKPDGTRAVFDLASGRKNSGRGDVSIRITKGAKSANKQFDWEVTLEAVGSGAGLLESQEEFMTAAPDAGYQPSWKFRQKAGEGKYQPEMQAKFFVKTAGGQFARIEVRVLPDYNDTAAVDLVSYLNPKPGDRNLEFDPAKSVKSP